MFKVGIIGSDNSHALAFSKLVNFKDEKTGEYRFPDVRITGIFGLDPDVTKEVAEKGNIPFIAEKPEDLMGKVDAVMVVFRHGDLHAPYALPFIKAGIPTWIDKPFTIKISDARNLIEAAEANNTLLTGGSTCKYAQDILDLKDLVENSSDIGKVTSGIMNFPSTLENEYGGIYFYGPHLAEMTMAVFGYDVQSVTTSVNNGNVMAIAKYDRYHVAMNFIENSPKFIGVLYTDKDTIVKEIDISIVYLLGFTKFVEMLRSGKRPLPLEHLLAPTLLLNAISKSIETGEEVFLNQLG